MLSIGNLALKPTDEPQRQLVTPGQLYRMLSAEFRQQRPARCSCRMPMVTIHGPEHAGPANWGVERRSRACALCEALVSGLVSRYRLLYEVRDPEARKPMFS
jgi:hypothetical protein